MIKFLLFALFLIILFICKPVVEGFPNENQYPVCNAKFSKGETNYAIESNPLEKPEKGFYSSIIKQTKEKIYQNILNHHNVKDQRNLKIIILMIIK